MIANDRQTISCTVVHGDAQRRIVVARSIEDSIRLVGALPQCTRPEPTFHAVTAARHLRRHPQSGETRAVDRHEPQLAAHLHGRDGAPGEILEWLARSDLPCGLRKQTTTKQHQSRLNWCPFFRGKPWFEFARGLPRLTQAKITSDRALDLLTPMHRNGAAEAQD